MKFDWPHDKGGLEKKETGSYIYYGRVIVITCVSKTRVNKEPRKQNNFDSTVSCALPQIAEQALSFVALS